MRVFNYQKTPKPVPVSPLILLTSLHLGWCSKLITVGLQSMWYYREINQDAKILYSSALKRATGQFMGATFNAVSISQLLVFK